ncbi:MAG: DEAD/DEAH box helicase, partial [Bacteroidales bacterium]
TPENKNTWLFSATMPKEIKAMTKHYMSDPVEITIGKRNEGAANVTHYYYMVNARDRYLALKRIIDFYPEIYSIIFCRTRRETQEVAEQLIKDGYNADALHGDLSQAQRDNAMSRFRLKNLQLLVATDVAARGLDVTNLTHVLNYNLPDDTEQYTHRSGRTGRASSTGISIAIVTSREKGRIKDIEKTLHKTFELKQIPQGEEICAKQVLFQVDRMLQVDLGENEIENYLPGIYEKLNDLSKEDLVKRFVSLEFNRFLAYYRNAPAVEDLSVSRKGDIRGDRREGERSSRSLDSRGTKTPEGWVRLFVNLGHMDGLRPQNLIGLVNDYVRDKDLKIGRIEICKTCSFMEVEDGAESKAIQALNGSMYGDRKVYVETAKPESESDREGRDSRSNSRPRRDSRSDRPERSDRSERYGRSSRSDSSDRGGYRGSDRRSSGSSSRTQRAYSASKGDRRSGSSKRRSDSDR